MRTTIRLEGDLLRQAKARAAASGRSLNDFIADAVRAALSDQRREHKRVPLPTFKGGMLAPGVDLDDTSALLDLMEWPEPAATRRAMVAERPQSPPRRSSRRRSAE